MVDKSHFCRENGRYLGFLVDKQEITTESIVSYFGFPATTAKRYLRQLTEYGYLEAYGSNKNRTYKKRWTATPDFSV